jgi:hypothetical protein
MNAPSFLAPLVGIFHAVVESQSLTKLFTDWSTIDLIPSEFIDESVDLNLGNFTEFSNEILAKIESDMDVPHIVWLRTQLIAMIEASADVPDQNAIFRLEQQSLLSMNSFLQVTYSHPSREESERWFAHAKKFMMEYAAVCDKLVRQAREAAEAVERERLNRVREIIISDTEDEPYPARHHITINPDTDSVAVIPLPKVRERSRRMTTLQPVPGGGRLTRAALAASIKALISGGEAPEGQAPPAVPAIRGDPNEHKVFRAQSVATPAFRSDLPLTPEGTESTLSELEVGGEFLDEEGRANQTPDAWEVELREFIRIGTTKGIPDEVKRKRFLSVLRKWRKKKITMVKPKNIVAFNTACNGAERIIRQGRLIPKKVFQLQRLFETALTFLNVW